MVRPSPSLPPRWRWLALRAGRSINRAALPFLRDADLNDDDYELQPPKPKLEMLQLMGIAFFAVSGSAYGVEEIVPLGGPFLSLAALVIAPAVWSAPMLLVTAELSVALPRAGGCAAARLGGCEETHWSHRGRVVRYVVWVEEALGAMPSLLNAMANLACSVLDCSLHPAAAHAELVRAASRHSLTCEQVPAAPDSLPAQGAALRRLLRRLLRLRRLDPHQRHDRRRHRRRRRRIGARRRRRALLRPPCGGPFLL